MSKLVNQPTLASGSELTTPAKKPNLQLTFFTYDLVNITVLLFSITLLLQGALSLVRGNSFLGALFFAFAIVVTSIYSTFSTYVFLTRTIFRLRCQDITPRRLQPLFSKLERWKKLPGAKGIAYLHTASSLSIFRAYLGDTDTAVKEHQELLAEHIKSSQGKDQSLGIRNAYVRAVMLSNLGHLLILNNQYPEAEQKLEESIAIYETEKKKVMGEVYPRVDLARIMIDRLEFEEALQQLNLATERLHNHETGHLVYMNIDVEKIACKAYSAVCQFKLGNDSEAHTLTEEVITLLPTGQTTWTFIGVSHAISMLARVLIERDEITDAEQLVYMSSHCLTCETHPDFLEFKGVSDDILKKLEKRKE